MGLINLRVIRNVSLFAGLKVTNQVVYQREIFSKSVFREAAAVIGLSTMIKMLVSSANKRIFDPMSVTISFIYRRNSKGPGMNP